MAIKIELGESYGMDGINEVMDTIKIMQEMGMSDDEINKVLERSKTGGDKK